MGRPLPPLVPTAALVACERQTGRTAAVCQQGSTGQYRAVCQQGSTGLFFNAILIHKSGAPWRDGMHPPQAALHQLQQLAVPQIVKKSVTAGNK